MNSKTEGVEKIIKGKEHLIKEALKGLVILIIGIILTYLLNFKYKAYTDILNYTDLKYWWEIGLVFALGFIIITLVCGTYQNKVEDNKINIATVLKDKSIKTREEKMYSRLESLVNIFIFLAMLLVGLAIPRSICTVICALSTLVIILNEGKNRFKLVDLFYTFYSIGAIVIIIKNITL